LSIAWSTVPDDTMSHDAIPHDTMADEGMSRDATRDGDAILLSATGLTKRFGEFTAVDGIDFAVRRGECFGFLGPNGAGKSTTLDMLLGLSEPDTGAVSVFGRGPHNAVAAGEVGAMLQTGGLIGDLSVQELVSMMAALYPRPRGVEDVLALTGILPLADRRTQKLSGGQTQRVRLALALVSDPELLVLDERYGDAHDIEISGAGLEQAFLALTSGESQPAANEEVFA
jgi:ABC-2 type transport system ATP-binding protein